MSKFMIRVFSISLTFLVLLSACELNCSGSSSVEVENSDSTAAMIATLTLSPILEDPSTPKPFPSRLPPTETPEPTSTPNPSPTPSWIGPESFPENFNPLTGLEFEDPGRLERRPVMIKVSNYPASLRPHSGLSYADIVFSYYIGVGMTRYLALFYGQDAWQVGPVRSGRLVDPQLVNLYGGFLGMVGADQVVWKEIYRELPGRYLTEKPIHCPALCNDGYGTAFGDSAAFTERVRELELDDQRPELPGMRFDSLIPDGGVEVSKVWFYYSYLNQVQWDYDPEAGAYLRSQEKTLSDGTVELEPMTDRLTEEQLAFKNVVILFAWHDIIKPELVDIELQTDTTEQAFLLRDGLMYEISYSAVSPTTPLRFYDSQGQPISFKPGNTWIEIVGLGSVVKELEPGYWKVRFYP